MGVKLGIRRELFVLKHNRYPCLPWETQQRLVTSYRAFYAKATRDFRQLLDITPSPPPSEWVASPQEAQDLMMESFGKRQAGTRTSGGST